MYICAEDQLSRVILEKLVKDILAISDPHILGKRSGGVSHIIKRLPKYLDLGKREFTIVLTDLDKFECEPACRADMFSKAGVKEPLPRFMVFGIAKREAESWLLADRNNLSDFLEIPMVQIDPNSETNTLHPKEYLVSLARQSKSREVKDAIVPSKGAIVGLGYNNKLCQFASENWDHSAAAENSSSLRRMRTRIEELTK